MKHALTVAWFEYRRHLLTRHFLVMTFGLPLFVAALVAVSVVAAHRMRAKDSADWALVGADSLPGAQLMLPDEEAAAALLERGEIHGYVVLEDRGHATVRGVTSPPDAIRSALESRALGAVLAEAPPERRAPLREPMDIHYMVLDAGQLGPASGTHLALQFALAFLLPLLFALAVLFGTSFLVSAVTEEKENRVMEILVTSVTPRALIAGKVLGLGGLSLTQTAAWVATVVTLVLALGTVSVGGVLRSVPWSALGLSVPFFLLGYLLYATVMVGIGAAVGQPREAQQVAGFVSMILMVPFMLVAFILVAPGSRVAVTLSVFPLFAPVAMPMRLLLSAAPPRDVALGLLLLGATAWLATGVVGRVFRASMLLHGQRLSPKGLLDALRS